MTRSCAGCKHGDPAVDAGVTFYFCRLAPPKSVVVRDEIAWVVPPMAAIGWCGQFRFSILKWLRRGKGT